MSGIRSGTPGNKSLDPYARLRPPRKGRGPEDPPSRKSFATTLRQRPANVEATEAVPNVVEPNRSEMNPRPPASDPREAAEERARNNAIRESAKREKSLNGDNWILRRGHTATYVGIFLFTLTLYFRPYELIPSLSGLSSLALVIAVLTLVVYIPTQLAAEGTLTALTTEVKCVLLMALWGALTIPIAKDTGLAIETYTGTFIKVVLIFIVMVNALRTRARLKGLIWLAIAVGLMLTYQAIDMYQKGEFKTEGYRVSVDFGGMFGNPNDLAMHLAIVTPLAVVLGLSTRRVIPKLAYFGMAGAMIVGLMVTQSRGGFLGLATAVGVLIWKFGRRKRLKAVMIMLLFGASFVAFAPSQYNVRLLSIFDTSLDPVGSSDQRTELLKRSILVTLRNPAGIGIGNFPVVGQANRETHNAYTQVSSELGWLCFAAYMVFLFSPFRKLGMLERGMDDAGDHSWDYYLAIGLQACLAAYMVSSFFGSVAYQWFVYFPIAFAICLRRLHAEKIAAEEPAGQLPKG